MKTASRLRDCKPQLGLAITLWWVGVCKRKRDRVSVYVYMYVCVFPERVWREILCVCERVTERERERNRVRVCVHPHCF